MAAVGSDRAGPPAILPSYKAVGSREGGVLAAFLSWVHSACPARPTLGIEELCQKREELCRQIQQEEDEKQRLQSEVRQLTEKLARVNENLARKIASRNEFDRTIAETEAAYLKILESSQTLLSVLKREAGNLTKGTASEQKSSGGKEGELMRP
ncbi:Sjoegren syndrome nuclear autoantigen 1 [Suricata suricatta]|uniref:Sjoegren syndrome nuclear autoantigen 1 n=1 Tax=Suricata suricatta TaxID=37032 RepID=UPI00115564E8|nr:Sjoegren syndrome nuclear autoantigen 1 [Suricata suricatta]